MRKLFIAMLSLLSINVFAAPSAAPTCTPIEVKSTGNVIMLPGPQEAHTAELYFLKNNVQQSVWLDHPSNKAAASAGWSSYLRAGNWAALVLSRKNFAISCSVISPGKVDQLDCAKTVLICKAKTPDSIKNQKNTYWLTEDQPWDDLSKAMAKRGVRFN